MSLSLGFYTSFFFFLLNILLLCLLFLFSPFFFFFFFLIIRRPPRSPLFPYPPLSRSQALLLGELARRARPLPRTLCEVHGDDQPVLAPGGDAHGCNIGRHPRLAQPLRRRQGRQKAAEALCAAYCRLLPPVAAQFWTHAHAQLHAKYVLP